MPVTQKPAIEQAIASLMRGTHRDPFAVLGPHTDEAGTIVVRAFQPAARTIELRLMATDTLLPMDKIDRAGLFQLRRNARVAAAQGGVETVERAESADQENPGNVELPDY